MKKLLKYICAGGFILVCLIGVFQFADAKTFKGRVIDADTKEPLEGAVVVAYWYKARDTIAGESTTLKDVKECVTGKNGEWSITGPKGRPHNPNPLLSLFTDTYYTTEPQFIVFKPGYCSWPNGSHIESCKEKMKIGGSFESADGMTFEFPKLTKREDRIEAQSMQLPLGPGALDKMKELIRLLNEEGRRLGLGEVYK